MSGKLVEREGKRCFFEKKKQKTFIPLVRTAPDHPGKQANGNELIKKFFWFFLFTKRTPLLCVPKLP